MLSPLLTAVLALLALSLLSLLSRHRAVASGLPPGPPALPLLGNLLQISPFRTLQSLLKLSERYGPVFTVWLGSRPVLVLRGTEAVREALVGSPEVFAGRGRLPTIESTFRDTVRAEKPQKSTQKHLKTTPKSPKIDQNCVVFADGERWRQLRRFS
ncbi:cytochrome P450 2B10-like [Zonotrichia albicollis]|uniref:cytochrome P450 2B10-like n=1 Tax=Zonotrichia albicollis TaxID=44394 RepID=UPI003D80F56D